jgi:hypothetical protein
VEKIRHTLAIALAVGAFVALSAAPAVANDHHRDHNGDHHRDHKDREDEDETDPCGSLFDYLAGRSGDCGVLGNRSD